MAHFHFEGIMFGVFFCNMIVKYWDCENMALLGGNVAWKCQPCFVSSLSIMSELSELSDQCVVLGWPAWLAAKMTSSWCQQPATLSTACWRTLGAEQDTRTHCHCADRQENYLLGNSWAQSLHCRVLGRSLPLWVSLLSCAVQDTVLYCKYSTVLLCSVWLWTACDLAHCTQ